MAESTVLVFSLSATVAFNLAEFYLVLFHLCKTSLCVIYSLQLLYICCCLVATLAKSPLKKVPNLSLHLKKSFFEK